LNTFFRIAIFLCLALLVFTLAINFVNWTEAFPIDVDSGISGVHGNDTLSKLTSLSDPNMNFLWAICTTVTGAAAIGISVLTRSIVPVGVYVFGAVFWTSWIRMWSITQIGSLLPVELTSIFFIAAIFLFIAAVVGMLTGSG